MDDFHNVTNTLISVLRKGVTIINRGKKTHYPLAVTPKTMGIFETKIRMINSNFNVDYHIDRRKLAKILQTHHDHDSIDDEFGYIQFKYSPTGGHSCVNIKHRYDENNRPSIFVFQTGSIIITGAKNYSQIISAYKFINKLLERYYSLVQIPVLDIEEVQADIRRWLREEARQRTRRQFLE